ncbi:DUF1761 domain-containing protein [Portibacter lacus]|uniref:DUF1761 domain-containing protein n=1 Tax=Portibacter lacus TaxID=1099794 RepID=A0AA37WFG9_9BACT|nr:DUF1761 domain-containing protein [Portibacter lacus]GLR17624.1 hypothetical protein GCM10007940_22390 [Portibacter lacus]
MPEFNILAILVAAIVPNIIGALYYGPLFGKTWLESFGMTAEDMKGRNEALIYGGALLCSFVIAFFLFFFMSMGHRDVLEGGEVVINSFATFKHGAFHGFMMFFGLVMPVIIALALFHKTKLKNVLLNIGFWALCFAVMGGILDVWR